MKRILFVTLIVLLLCASLNQPSQTAAQSPTRFSIEQVLSAPFPENLIAAPKGQRIAWTFNATGKRNVWVADGPDFKARQLTPYNHDDGQELTKLRFTHDGRWVVYVRGGAANNAGEFPNPTSDVTPLPQAIYAVSVETGQVRLLGEGNDPVPSPVGNLIAFTRDGQILITSIVDKPEPQLFFAARGDNDSPQWSPDGRKIAFVSHRGTHNLIGVYEFEKQTIRWIAPSIDRDAFPRWSPDGKHLAFIRQPARGSRPRPLFEDTPDPWAIYVADVMTGAAQAIWRSGSKLDDSLPPTIGANVLQWGIGANDQPRIIFASEMDGWLRLYSMAATGGEVKALTPAKSEVEDVTMSPDRRKIYFSTNNKNLFLRHIYSIQVADAALQYISRNSGHRQNLFGTISGFPVTTGASIDWNPVVTADSNYLVFLSSSSINPAQPFYLPMKDLPDSFPRMVENKVVQISQKIADTAYPPSFPSSQLTSPTIVKFKAADGLDIEGQLFLPFDTKPGEKLPAVIYAHGGPRRQMLMGWHYLYYYHYAYGFNQWLANKGYAVLSVNFRGGTGYGRAFRQAAKRGGGGAAEYQDIVAAANYLRARAEIDPQRIGIWGGSYGGFLSALALARNSDLFACGVDIHGVHDWATRLASIPGQAGNRDAMKIALESSPIGWVEQWKSPALFIHGDDDRSVAFSQTVDLAVRLRERNVYFEQLIFPDEAHDFLLHKTWLELYKASADFLDRHLKNKRP